MKTARSRDFWKRWEFPTPAPAFRPAPIGMHKVTTKTVLTAHGIPVPAGMVIKRGEKVSSAQVLRTAKLRWPVVVKPASARVHDRRHNCEEACSVERGVGAGPSIRSWMRWWKPTFLAMRSRFRSLAGKTKLRWCCLLWRSSRRAGSMIFLRNMKKARRSISVRLRFLSRSQSKSEIWRSGPMKCWTVRALPVWIFASHRAAVLMSWRSIQFRV